MNSLISKNLHNRNFENPGYIEIVNQNNETLETFDNRLEDVDENNENIKPGNFLIINNENFRIIFSCNYIKSWVSNRKKALAKNILKNDAKLHNNKK